MPVTGVIKPANRLNSPDNVDQSDDLSRQRWQKNARFVPVPIIRAVEWRQALGYATRHDRNDRAG